MAYGPDCFFISTGKLDFLSRFCLVSLLPGVSRTGAVVNMSVGEVWEVFPPLTVVAGGVGCWLGIGLELHVLVLLRDVWVLLNFDNLLIGVGCWSEIWLRALVCSGWSPGHG